MFAGSGGGGGTAGGSGTPLNIGSTSAERIIRRAIPQLDRSRMTRNIELTSHRQSHRFYTVADSKNSNTVLPFMKSMQYVEAGHMQGHRSFRLRII